MIPDVGNPPGKPLRILHLEDNSLDAELIRDSLNSEGINCEIDRVQSRPEFQSALSAGRYDLVLSDYTLPGFDGMQALSIAQKYDPHLPFIFVSGTIGEEQAVDSLKSGAVDYVIKDRLSRLVVVLRRALKDVHDRADKLRIEEELRQRNELIRQITENVEDLVTVLDLDGRHIFVSPSYGKLFGNAQALLGTLAFEEIHPGDRGHFKQAFGEVIATGQPLRTSCRLWLKDHTARHIESQGSVIRDQHGRISHVVMISRDVTERVQNELKLREQAALLDRAQDAIFVRDLEQRVTYWNSGAERAYGWTREEMLGQRASDLLYGIGASNREEIWKTVLERGDWIGELNQVTKAGKEIRVTSRRTLLRDNAGHPAAILNINTDITEKKQIEDQLLRSQRLENIGALAGGISHDLNNVLAPILMSVEILRQDMHDEENRRILDTVKTSAQRGAELVNQILQFARGARGEPISLDLQHLIKEVVRLARDTFPRTIRIDLRAHSNLHLVSGDATQLHQVLLNLCVNARDAMPGGGVLTLDSSNVVLTGTRFPGVAEPVHGNYVLLTVSDTGAGIPPDLKEKIFLPFFTTKPQGKGTGLGLSTVARIVKDHRGFIEVESEAGRGATFKVYLPAAAASQRPSQGAPERMAPLGHGEWILLADDELALLEITKDMLEAYHYRVLSAKDGAKALSLFREHRQKIRIVITDLMMPVMDGPTLIRALREIEPGVKIICVSGLASEAKLAELDLSLVQAFLRKPFTAEQLLIALHDTLVDK